MGIKKGKTYKRAEPEPEPPPADESGDEKNAAEMEAMGFDPNAKMSQMGEDAAAVEAEEAAQEAAAEAELAEQEEREEKARMNLDGEACINTQDWAVSFEEMKVQSCQIQYLSAR